MKCLNVNLLKQCTTNELRLISQLEQQLFTDGYWEYNTLQTLFCQNHHYFFGLTVDGKLSGYCIVQVLFDTAEILRIGVDKSCQGQGLAKQIFRSVFKFLECTDAEKLLLEVRADNLRAIGLYQGLGFKQIHVRKNYYKNQKGTFTDALILQKDLS